MELIEAAELATENRLLQPTGDAMATGEAIITAELMAAGEADVQSIQTTRDGGIVASRDRCFACWPFREPEFSLVLIFVASKLDGK